MENKPVVRIWAKRFQPEYEQRYLKWQSEVYCPLYITLPGIEELDDYRIVKENPQYTRTLLLAHYENRDAPLQFRGLPLYKDIGKDYATWAGRSETVWFAAYEQIASFKKDAIDAEKNPVPGELSTVIQLEGYTFTNEEQEKYDAWFDKWGREVFVPLLMRLPGLRGYVKYKLIEIERAGLMSDYTLPKTREYPPSLSILTFDSIRAFENYENSLELAAFKVGLQAPFPLGLSYQWYVQYQLMKSWRK